VDLFILLDWKPRASRTMIPSLFASVICDHWHARTRRRGLVSGDPAPSIGEICHRGYFVSTIIYHGAETTKEVQI
jgi:hypothetical protein